MAEQVKSWWPDEVAQMLEGVFGAKAVRAKPSGFVAGKAGKEPYFIVNCGDVDAKAWWLEALERDVPSLKAVSRYDDTGVCCIGVMFSPDVQVRREQVEAIERLAREPVKMVTQVTSEKVVPLVPKPFVKMEVSTIGSPVRVAFAPMEELAQLAYECARGLISSQAFKEGRATRFTEDMAHNTKVTEERLKALKERIPGDRFFDRRSGKIVDRNPGFMLQAIARGLAENLGPGTFYDTRTQEYREISEGELAMYAQEQRARS